MVNQQAAVRTEAHGPEGREADARGGDLEHGRLRVASGGRTQAEPSHGAQREGCSADTSEGEHGGSAARRRDATAARGSGRTPARRLGERGSELARGREAVGGELLERGEHRIFERLGDAFAVATDWRRSLRHHLGHYRLRGAGGEGRVSGEHLVRHAAQGVHIGASRDVALTHGLLGTHVVRGAEAHAGLGHATAAGLAGGEGDAEVGHQGAAIVQQDVLRLDVAMNNAVAVGVIESGGNLCSQAHSIGHRQLLLAVQPIAERLTLDERHDVEEGLSPQPPLRFAERGHDYRTGVMQREDVRVLQVSRGADLGEKALGADDRGKLGAENLDRHLACMAKVFSQVDCGHPPLAQLAFDPVPVGQAGREAIEWRAGHRATRFPSLNTARTRRTAEMSRVGSPSTATRSAREPGAMRPSRSPSLNVAAFPLVAALSAASGVMPFSTISSSYRTFCPWAKTPTSPPKQMVTPAARAARKAARLSCTRWGISPAPRFQPSKYSA